MKNMLTSLLESLRLKRPAQAQPEIQLIDPRSILFSLPTISNDLPPLEPADSDHPSADLRFHEDDWRQVEFRPPDTLPDIRRLLNELNAFETANRVSSGWRQIYTRKVARTSILSGAHPVAQLEDLLGVKSAPGPILFPSFSSAQAGRVTNGFTLPLGGNISLYGYTDGLGIPVLGASVGPDPDDIRLTNAFMALNEAKGLLLVDWLAQLVLTSVTSSRQVQVWRP